MLCYVLALYQWRSPNNNDSRLHNQHSTPRTRTQINLQETPHPRPPPSPSRLRTSQRLLPHRLLKDLQRHRRLIIRYLVPGSKDPEEAEVVDRLKRASFSAIDSVRSELQGGEGRGAGIVDGVGGVEAAEPVADPVGVAGPHDDADAALDDGREGGEEAAGVVARGGEFVVGRVGTLGVGCFGADGAGDGGFEEVAGVGGGWVRVGARFADVVDVEVVEGDAAVGGGGAEGAFDVVVAGVVGVFAGRVGACGGGAFGEERGTALCVGVGELGVLGCGDDGFVGVVVGEVDVGLLLNRGIVPAVVDAQSYEIDVITLDAAGLDGGVLGLEIAST